MLIAAVVLAHGITLSCPGAAPVTIAGLNNQVAEARVAIPEGAQRCTLTRIGTFPTHLDLVAVEQGGARVELRELAPELKLRDLTMLELAKPLTLTLAQPAHGATLIIAGRQELLPPSGHPFVLRAAPYPLGAKRDTPLFKIETHPTSGHPDAWATAWAHDDGKTLFARLDFASDVTDDHGDDYAELRAGNKTFRITDEQLRFGKVSMQRTDEAPYLHKVYEFAIPLRELSQAKRGGNLQLAFAAYGTASSTDVGGGGISRDARRFAQRVEHKDVFTSELQFYAYADGGWSLSQDRTVAEDGGTTFPLASSWVDPDAVAMYFAPYSSFNNNGVNPEIDQIQPDGGLQITTLTGPDFTNNAIQEVALAASASRFHEMGCGNGGCFSGGMFRLDDGGVVALEHDGGGITTASNPGAAWMTADGTRLDHAAGSGTSGSVTIAEWTRAGTTWTGPVDAGTYPVQSEPSAGLTGSHAEHSSMSSQGSYLAFCDNTAASSPQLWQHDGGGFVQVTTGLESGACSNISVDEAGALAYSTDGGGIFLARPTTYASQQIAQSDGGLGYMRLAEDNASLTVEVQPTDAGSARVFYLGQLSATLLPGVAIAAPASVAADAGLLSFVANGNPTDLVLLHDVAVRVQGTLAPSVNRVHLFRDVDQNGAVSAGDVELAAVAPSVGGVADFNTLQVGVASAASSYLLASAELLADAGAGTLQLSMDPSAARAVTATLGYDFAPAGGVVTGPQFASVALVDGGTGDAGGADSGVPDAGTVDAGGTPDAGTPDAGTVDAGTSSDGGTGGSKSSGCGCTSAGPDAALFALGLLAMLRRRRA